MQCLKRIVERQQHDRRQRAPAVELVGVGLARLVEVEREFSVDADAEVVVHDVDATGVLVGVGGVGRVLDVDARRVLLAVVRVEDHRPSTTHTG